MRYHCGMTDALRTALEHLRSHAADTAEAGELKWLAIAHFCNVVLDGNEWAMERLFLALDGIDMTAPAPVVEPDPADVTHED